MYICNRCGTIAETLPTYPEYHPYGDSYAVETMTDPRCQCGGVFYEAERCEECLEYFASSSLIDGLCADCYREEDEYDETRA